MPKTIVWEPLNPFHIVEETEEVETQEELSEDEKFNIFASSNIVGTLDTQENLYLLQFKEDQSQYLCFRDMHNNVDGLMAFERYQDAKYVAEHDVGQRLREMEFSMDECVEIALSRPVDLRVIFIHKRLNQPPSMFYIK